MRYVIAVGANLGEAERMVDQALGDLADRMSGSLVARSSLYRTDPVGGPDQPDFVNAVAIVETDLVPLEVLRVLQSMENEAGRVRDVRWGPRTLDLDVIAADDLVSEDPALTVPHPRAHERAFVLVPWLEIDPEAAIVGKGPVRDLVEAGFDDQGVVAVAQ